jgi:multisubunit Na+/H+ antiporter MnhB subunit
VLVLSLHKHFNAKPGEPNPFDMLITPSWMSLLLGIVVSLIVVLGSLGLAYYRSSTLQTLINLDQTQSTKVDGSYRVTSENDRLSVILSDLPLFIFWAGVGMAAYSFTTGIWGSFQSVAELGEEMNYVHVKRRELLTYAFERLALRIGALIGLLALLNYTVHRILPYSVALSYAGTTENNWLTGVLFVLFGMLVLLVVSHAHTILLRLIVLKPRLFG